MVMEKLKDRAIVSNPGHVLVAYHVALALQQAGVLDRFETSFYYKGSTSSRVLLSMLPKEISAWLVKQLRRRWQDGLGIAPCKTCCLKIKCNRKLRLFGMF